MRQDRKLFEYIENNRWLKDAQDNIVGEITVIHNKSNEVFEIDGYIDDKRFSFDIDEFDKDVYFSIIEDDDGIEDIQFDPENIEIRLKKELGI